MLLKVDKNDKGEVFARLGQHKPRRGIAGLSIQNVQDGCCSDMIDDQKSQLTHLFTRIAHRMCDQFV